MTEPYSLAARWRAAYQRSERKLIVGYLAVLSVLVLVLAAAPARRVVLHAAEDAAARWDDRWSRQLAEAEALIAAGALDSAAIYLEHLDQQFPARHVKHARDAERQRLLRALGATYTALGRDDRALLTYRKLVAFEPRSYANYYDLAQACIRAGEEAEARQHLLSALAINPTHLASVRSYVKLAYDVRDYAAVVRAYQTYLDAFMVQEAQVRVGESSVVVPVVVDATFHDVSALMSLPANSRLGLSIDAGGLPVDLERVVLQPPVLTGGKPQDAIVLQPANATNTTLMTGVAGAERIDLRLRLRKPVDPTLWNMVERSYRNLLDSEGLARTREASMLMATVAAADSVRRPE
jgi:tetratricopeptide (TPR) repeat protein